jgi:hypothetical protein
MVCDMWRRRDRQGRGPAPVIDTRATGGARGERGLSQRAR